MLSPPCRCPEMEKTFRIVGDVPGVRFESLERALASLGWTLRVHDDFRLRVSGEGIELEVEKTAAAEGGVDFLIMGDVTGMHDTGIKHMQAIARVSDGAGIVYQLELDDEEDFDDATKLVLRHPLFPKGRYAED